MVAVFQATYWNRHSWVLKIFGRRVAMGNFMVTKSFKLPSLMINVIISGSFRFQCETRRFWKFSGNFNGKYVCKRFQISHCNGKSDSFETFQAIAYCSIKSGGFKSVTSRIAMGSLMVSGFYAFEWENRWFYEGLWYPLQWEIWWL